MTKQQKKTLKVAGIPSVAYSKQYGQFYTRIGYKRSRSGIRQRAFFYLGKDQKEAIAKSVKIKTDWRAIKSKGTVDPCWPSKYSPLSASLVVLSPDELKDAVAKYHRDQTSQALDLDIAEQTPTLRIEQVETLYGDYRRSLLGIGGDEGVKASTLNGDLSNLRRALDYLDRKATIQTLTFSAVEKVKLKIFARVGKDNLSKRTAVNYCRALKSMLDWAHLRNEIPYRKDVDLGELFKFRTVSAPKIAAYDANLLKKLLGKMSKRGRLYTYLALNCGYYQSDIGTLLKSEIVEDKGRFALQRKRNKTSAQNDFEAVHTLWPETHKLLMEELAEPNKYGLALLDDNGERLYHVEDGKKTDKVRHPYEWAMQQSGVKLSFKQLRKLGASAMERLGGQQPRRLYKAGTIDSGDKVYVAEAWANLTPVLDRWGDELRADGVLF